MVSIYFSAILKACSSPKVSKGDSRYLAIPFTIYNEEFIEEESSLEEKEIDTQAVSEYAYLNKNNSLPISSLLLLDDSFFLEVMVESQPLMIDSVAYQPINLYPNQLNLFDNRDIYSDVTYKANDPLTTFNISIEENQEQRYKLQQKLDSMVWKN